VTRARLLSLFRLIFLQSGPDGTGRSRKGKVYPDELRDGTAEREELRRWT
jgi:hypothetical protein